MRYDRIGSNFAEAAACGGQPNPRDDKHRVVFAPPDFAPKRDPVEMLQPGPILAQSQGFEPWVTY